MCRERETVERDRERETQKTNHIYTTTTTTNTTCHTTYLVGNNNPSAFLNAERTACPPRWESNDPATNTFLPVISRNNVATVFGNGT